MGVLKKAMKKADDTFEELIREAHENAQTDRKTLLGQMEKLAELSGGSADSAVLLGDTVIKVNDCLIKNNSQIIQLAQLKLKDKESTEDKKKKDEKIDTDSVYDEIEEESKN